MTEFSERLRRIGLKQADLSALLGVTPETVSRWANRRLETPKYAETVLDLLVLIKAPLRGAQDLVRKSRGVEPDGGEQK